MMVVARFGASLLTALIMGWAWARWVARSGSPAGFPAADPAQSRWAVFAEAARHDSCKPRRIWSSGAAAAATMHVVVPTWGWRIWRRT